MNKGRAIFVAPAVCLLILSGMAVEAWSQQTASDDVEQYHARAKAAVESIPTKIETWSSVPVPVPREAITLLHPNAFLSVHYSDNDVANPHWRDRWADLLVDQCRDARDMAGHWPPNCYVNSGWELTDADKISRDWAVAGITLPGMEYHFRQTTATETTRMAVYNFLIVPGQPICRDMNGVYKAGGNYQRRFLGAAQFQVVMDGTLGVGDRDEIFKTLIGPCVPVIRTLQGEIK